MSEQQAKSAPWMWFMLLAFAIIFLFRFSRIGLLFGLGIAVIGAAIYYAFDFYKKRKAEKQLRESIEGSIKIRTEFCDQQLERLREEILEIKKSIKELEGELKIGKDLPLASRQQTQRLIEGFQEQRRLRLTKMEFYQTCLKKLDRLLRQHQINRQLKGKQEQLRQLEERIQDDMVDMETFKSDLEYDRQYLETIETLSLRMLDSQSVVNAQAVKKELELMTRELEEDDDFEF